MVCDDNSSQINASNIALAGGATLLAGHLLSSRDIPALNTLNDKQLQKEQLLLNKKINSGQASRDDMSRAANIAKEMQIRNSKIYKTQKDLITDKKNTDLLSKLKRVVQSKATKKNIQQQKENTRLKQIDNNQKGIDTLNDIHNDSVINLNKSVNRLANTTEGFTREHAQLMAQKEKLQNTLLIKE
jgi:hypothetical protein